MVPVERRPQDGRFFRLGENERPMANGHLQATVSVAFGHQGIRPEAVSKLLHDSPSRGILPK
jgi:hypothetical protein